MSREQIVRDTAYAIWEAEGKPVGRDAEHWRQAEARVEGSLRSPAAQQSSGPEAKPPAKGKATATAKTPAEAKPPAKAAATKPAATRTAASKPVSTKTK